MKFRIPLAGLAVAFCALQLASANASLAQQPPTPARPVAFYIHAHEDDWQLFMSPHLVQDVKSGKRVIVVYSTAGDAGQGTNYWNAREASAQASEQLASPCDGCHKAWTCSSQTFAGHPVLRCACDAIVAYRMRGPDGRPNGTGYTSNQCESLVKLRCGIKTLTTVDHSTTYTSWKDFVQTLDAIIAFEGNGAEAVELHAPDFDPISNPGDHSDHVTTGTAVLEIFAAHATNDPVGQPWSLTGYVDYDTRNRPENGSLEQVTSKAGTFLAYDRTMWEEWNQGHGQGSTLCTSYKNYSSWLFGFYHRSVLPTSVAPAPNCPAAACSSSAVEVQGSEPTD